MPRNISKAFTFVQIFRKFYWQSWYAWSKSIFLSLLSTPLFPRFSATLKGSLIGNCWSCCVSFGCDHILLRCYLSPCNFVLSGRMNIFSKSFKPFSVIWWFMNIAPKSNEKFIMMNSNLPLFFEICLFPKKTTSAYDFL